MLRLFNIEFHEVHLDGMPQNDVNAMISETLHVLPRLCRPLAQAVFNKTSGNPYFAMTFLQSLCQKRLLTYNLRDKCWEWRMDRILAENIAPNVLGMLTSNMKNCAQNVQDALKVASCFGIMMNATIARALASTDQYSGLYVDLEKAVDGRFLEVN